MIKVAIKRVWVVWTGLACAGALLAVAACSSSPAGNNGGGPADASNGDDVTADASVDTGSSATDGPGPDNTASDAPTGSDSGAGTDSATGADGGGGDDGSVLTWVGHAALPQPPSGMAYNSTTNELWVTSRGRDDAGTTRSAITIIDEGPFTPKATIDTGGVFGPIAVLPGLNKAYVGNETALDGGGLYGEIDEIDGVTHQAKTVATITQFGVAAQSIVADSTSNKVYASVSGSVLVIDGTTDTVVATVQGSDAGGLTTFGQLAIDPTTDSKLYVLGGDPNSYPMAGVVDTQSNVVISAMGGQDAGWVKSGGVAAYPDGGVAAIGTSSSTFLQVLDPVEVSLPSGYTVTAVAARGETIIIATVNACGKVGFFQYYYGSFVLQGPFQPSNWNYGTDVVDALLTAEPLSVGGGSFVVLTAAPPPGSSNGQVAPSYIDKVIINTAGSAADGGC